VKGVDDVLPAGGAALEQDQRQIGQVGQGKLPPAQQPVARRRDQAPAQREQVQVLQVG
jgi:hypothetical protein